MGLMRDLNQYLQMRGKRWHYVRRVPNEYANFDKRTFIRKALKTESLEVTRAKRDELVKADDQYWQSIASATDGLTGETRRARRVQEAMRNYEAAKQRAMKYGFKYIPFESLVAEHESEELMRRVEALERVSRAKPPTEDNAKALLGKASKPSVTLTQAFDIYCNQIAVSDLLGKSEAQKKSWRKVKLRAVNYFKGLHGDLPMDAITREHARAFYNWWAERLHPRGNQRGLSPSSANRDLGNMRKLYREYWEFEGDETRDNPLRNLSYGKHGIKDIPHFDDEWVRTRILAPKIFDGLKPQAALLLYGMIETGCRPSELANLKPENIILETDVPFIRIRPSENRQLKSPSSIRDISLVGVSRAAFKRAPKGFPHYHDKGTLLSASLMKAFRARGLFPTEHHRIYSLRHSFENRMLEAGLDYGLRCLLMGHKNSRPSYGDGGSMTYRRDELLKIAHPIPVGFEEALPEPY